MEVEIRSQVLRCPSVKSFSERERFTRHMLNLEKNPNFQLLRFCRKFATLVNDCSILPDKQNRKAAFSITWMKMLANFLPGGSFQEHLIVERFLLGQ